MMTNSLEPMPKAPTAKAARGASRRKGSPIGSWIQMAAGTAGGGPKGLLLRRGTAQPFSVHDRAMPRRPVGQASMLEMLTCPIK
jgi:hypothetical protein